MSANDAVDFSAGKTIEHFLGLSSGEIGKLHDAGVVAGPAT